jgi:hypothetical protein
MFGVHRYLHTGPAEHNLTVLSKQPAGHTQMHAPVSDWQLSNHLVDKLVVNLANSTMQEHMSVLDACPMPHNSCPLSLAVFDIVSGMTWTVSSIWT